MPDAQRLDMAIKYSAEPYSNNLLEVSEMAICLFLSCEVLTFFFSLRRKSLGESLRFGIVSHINSLLLSISQSSYFIWTIEATY